mgnify:CR=1 FL=1
MTFNKLVIENLDPLLKKNGFLIVDRIKFMY